MTVGPPKSFTLDLSVNSFIMAYVRFSFRDSVWKVLDFNLIVIAQFQSLCCVVQS